jgi:N-acetyl-gamma-glutamyl-phosphate reductase
MPFMIRAKIVGAGGYGGVGVAELLTAHPDAELGVLVDVENVGKPLSAGYPHLAGVIDDVIVAPDDPAALADYDVVFMATPDGVGMKLAPDEIARGAKVIDYSGDFRFNAIDSYRDYASRLGRDPTHASPDLLGRAVYGLPELHRTEVNADTLIVGNPGCFAVSCILGLAPAVKLGLIDPTRIICDCKTAVSGAGKKPSPVFHYPARYDNMNAYRLSGHQHVCEIERELGLLAGQPLQVTFTAQVVPMCRGIMSCLYSDLAPGQTQTTVLDAYRDFYAGEPFVRVYDADSGIGTVHVRGSNRANLLLGVDERTGRFRVVSHIDNLMKGQAGSALQNMNLLFGLPETAGLERPGIYP